MVYWEVIDSLRRAALAEAAAGGLMDAPLREAWVFAEILRKIPIHRVSPADRLAGDYGDESWSPIPPSPPAKADAWTELRGKFYCRTNFSAAHTTLDYPLVLQHGLDALLEEGAYSEAERITLNAVMAFAERYKDLGFAHCDVPRKPATSFAEALQSLWFLQTVTGIAERSYASLSMGRFDQYLYGWFAETDPAEAEALLREFLARLSRYGDAACVINIGGLDREGNDSFNALSRLVIELAAEAHRTSPLLSVRWNRKMSDADFMSVLRPELFEIGQPTIYCEEVCRKTLARRGVPAEDIEEWVVNSCMGLMIGGKEFSDMWAVVFNCLTPLELALNAGAGFECAFPFALQTSPRCSFESMEAILEQTLAYSGEIFKLLFDRHGVLNDEEVRLRPAPYVSALLDGIPGRDRLDGGARYHTANVDLFGVANLADALHALDVGVFQRRRHSLAEVVAAVRNNFSGAEPLRRELLAVPKYGSGDAAADAVIARLAMLLAERIEALNPGRRIRYMPSFHTLHCHVQAGLITWASPDGRHSGEPLAKNIGPMRGSCRNGLSGLLRSATAIDQTAFPGGQALDLYLDQALYATENGRRMFMEACKSFFLAGGLQLQINAVPIEALEQALDAPEKWGHLQVRIGGFSMRFIDLSRPVQLEMIARFRNGA